MIIMIFSSAHEMYIPMFYILLQSKLQEVYETALELAIKATDNQLKAISVTMDFEKGLINAITSKFPEGKQVLCNFHFKQAIRRKLLGFKISKEVISELMGPEGYINILTTIPIEEIVPKGIPYIRSKLNEGKYKVEFNNFWIYFEKVWMKSYDPQGWNVHDLMIENILSQIVPTIL